jgi:hypothetical protein
MRRRLPALITLCCALAAPAAASAARQQEATFQDDNRLVYALTPGDAAHTLDTLKVFGVDRVRISVFWKLVAPAPEASTKPLFDAADPAAYPPGTWDRYDNIVRMAAARGIGVNFDVTSPAPNWATGTPSRADIDQTYDPNPKEFGLFMRALGTRYSGKYVPVFGQPPLPRVNYWSIWNEPNQAGWLTPQWARNPNDPKHDIETAPRIYRSLVDAGYDALQLTGHTTDTVLVGETAPKGLVTTTGETRAIDALRFVRQLYCLDDNLQFEQGTSATLRGCPVSDQGAKFVASHPGLFKYTGWSHHPYELIFSPDTKPGHPDWVTTANLPDLQRLLTRIFQRYGQPLPGGAKQGVPLYLTEFGYQSDPPDPTAVSPAKQAAYINLAEYIAWRNPTVKTLSQFLLTDDKPVPGINVKKPSAWDASFQTGLLYGPGSGKPGAHKPAFAAYEMPIFVPARKVKRGHKLTVWGGVRMVATGTRANVSIEVRSKKTGAFTKIASTKTDGIRGYINTTVKLKRTALLRLAWRSPSGGLFHSRAVGITVK